MALFKRIYIALYVSIMAPHILLLLSARRENPIFRDIEVWSDRLLKKEIRKRTDLLANFVELMSQAPEFRSLFYYRLPRARFSSFFPVLKAHFISIPRLSDPVFLFSTALPQSSPRRRSVRIAGSTSRSRLATSTLLVRRKSAITSQ